MSGVSETKAQPFQVCLDSSASRRIPVTDEGNAQSGCDGGAVANFRERVEHPFDLFGCVLRRHRNANAALLRRDGWRNDGMCEDASIEQPSPHLERAPR